MVSVWFGDILFPARIGFLFMGMLVWLKVEAVQRVYSRVSLLPASALTERFLFCLDLF